jgi:hypothetical protein
MALQSSGAIKMSQIKAELGSSSNSLRAYSLQAGLSAPDKLSDFYGYAALGAFSFALWNGSVSVNLNGIVSYVTANAAAVSVSPTTFALVGTNTTQTIDVTVTVPSGYSNSGGTVTGTKTAVQPAKVFAYTDWVNAGGSVSINRNTGNVSYSNGTLGTVSSISPTSFDLVTSSTSRNVTVNVSVPSGYYNSGNTVSGTYTTTQAAADESIAITLNGSHNTWGPSGQGGSTTLSVDIVNIWNTAWTVQVSDSSWLSVVSSTGTGDGTTVLVAGPNYAGEAGYNGSVRSGWIKVYKTSDSGIYDIVNIYQEVGVAPTFKPTVSLTAPNNTIFGWNEYGNQFNYKTYTGTWTGGSTPTAGSFYMNSTDFAFVSTDSNVVISQPSTGNWVGTITNATSSPYSVGVYAVNQNNSTTTAKSATISFTLSNTAGSNSATATVGQSAAPPTFSFGDAGVSGFAVSQNGTITAPTVSAGSISSVTYTNSIGNASYSVVNTNTTRNATVYVTVPGGYSNSGGTVSGTVSATQISTPSFTFGDWTGAVSVDIDGYVTATQGNSAAAVSVSPTYYGITYSVTARAVTATVTVPGGYYNSGATVSDTVIVYQPATPAPCYRYYNNTTFDQFNVNYLDCNGNNIEGATVYADDYVCAREMYSSFMTYGGNC